MVLEGYEAVQESSTDEDAALSLPLPSAGLPAMDAVHQQQQQPPRHAHSDGAASPFTPDCQAQQRWGAGEASCFETPSPSPSADSQSQIMECIHKIEADLEHLKVPQTQRP